MAMYVDDAGDEFDLDGVPERVVSLVPSLTEAVAASRPDVLVGATDWCTHPATLDVVRLGGTKNPDLGSIHDLGPDLVIVSEEENRREDVEELRRRGLEVWVTDIRTVDGALESLGTLLDALGVRERPWLDRADGAWANPPQVVPGRRLRALVPIWRRPWMALGADTYAGDVLARLGVDVVFGDGEERYPKFTPGQTPPYDLVILPDEPYAFSPDDGPETFPGVPVAHVDGRALTWYGPAMVTAPSVLVDAIRAALAAGGADAHAPAGTAERPQTDEVLVDRDGPVVHVTFNRPHRHNAFTTVMYQTLVALFDELAGDESVRVVVLRGAGSVAFAAGNDISEFAALPDSRAILDYEGGVRRMLSALGSLPQVTVAVVDGLCVGGGLGVATYCDLRVASAASRFGYPIARTLGNALSGPLLERCVHVFGESLTREMLLASRLIDAQRAYGVGAVMSVRDDADELEAEVATIVDGLLHAAPLTLQATKQQLAEFTAYAGDPERDARLLDRVYSSDGFREGVRAFLAKEKPSFVTPQIPPAAR